jgi:succinate dehydrogenase / fumarate reductase, membrane anchor subunit
MSGTPAPARRFAGRPDDVPPGFVPLDARPAPIDALRAPSRAGSLWLAKAMSGVALVGFLGLHLVAQHLLVEGGLRNYDAVVAYLRQPLALIAEVGLLGSVILHAALGVRAVLVDLVRSERALRRASWVIGALAVAAFAYGVGLTLVVVRGG